MTLMFSLYFDFRFIDSLWLYETRVSWMSGGSDCVRKINLNSSIGMIHGVVIMVD